MLFFQGESDPLLVDAPAWVFEGLFWIGLFGLFVLGAAAAGVWTLVRRAGEAIRAAERLEVLDEVQRSLERLLAERDDLDLRRIEHVLIDLRDSQRRLEDALLQYAEKAQARIEGGGSSASAVAGPADVAERVTNRLLALGYDQVHLATPPEELALLGQDGADGEVLVEARRQGVLHKGRVLVRGGRLREVEIQPTYPIFP